MKKIKELLFGKRTNSVERVTSGIRYTVHPKHRPNQWEWMKEFNVGMLSDRRIIHLN